MKLLYRLTHRPREPRVVAATITFHHIDCEGHLWVDWTNELGAGRQRVWKVITEGGNYSTKVGEFGGEKHIGEFVISRTIQSQIFTTFLLALTDLKPIDTSHHIEPSDPYNILGVKKLVKLQRQGG